MKERKIHLGDLKQLLLVKKRKIIICGALASMVALGVLGLMRPKYRIVATFKEASSGEEMGSQNALSTLLKQYSSSELSTQAVTMMSSRLLLSEVGKKLGCQIQETQKEYGKRLWENCLAEMGKHLPDVDQIVWKDVHYLGEERKSSTLIVHNRSEFTFDGIEGRVGEIFVGDDISFFLMKMPKKFKSGMAYELTLIPEEEMVASLSRKLSVKLNKSDQSLVNLTFMSRDRAFGCEFLNELMESYKEYLGRESDRISTAQLAYLNMRQDELSDKLNDTLHDHASFLEEIAGEKGFIGLEEELNMLRARKKEVEARIFQMELERNELLGNAIPDSSPISQELHHCKTTISQLTNQRDQIALYFLKKGPLYAHSAGELPKEIDAFNKLSIFPKYIEAQIQSPREDSEGMDLDTARQVHVDLTKELNSCSLKKRQLMHLLNNMDKPGFDLTSMCSVLEDAFSQEAMSQAQKIGGRLRNESYLMEKEKARLQEEYALQREGLREHIREIAGILDCQIQVLEEKAQGIKKIMLGLLNQDIGMLSKEQDKIKHERLVHLERELLFLKDKLKENQEETQTIPERWLRENMLNIKSELNMSMIKGMSKLVESKNVEHHLKQVESKPIDSAYQPLKPQKRYLIVIALFIGILIAGAIYVFDLLRGLRSGLPVSLETLSDLERTVLGKIRLEHCPTTYTEAQESVLEVLRHTLKTKHAHIGIIGEKSYGLAQILAELIALEGKKVLLMNLSFNEEAMQPGLWQFLHSEVVKCPISNKGKFDLIAMGMCTKYGRELLQKKELRKFIAAQKEKYDALVLYSPAAPKSSEAKTMMEFVENIVVTLERESLNEINEYLRWEDRGNSVSFLAQE